MNIHKIHSVYFLGIGGIGMSALARYFNAMGKKVSGYDKTPTALTRELMSEGIHIHFEDHVDHIAPEIKNERENKDNVLVVYTPAVPKDHAELNYLRKHGFTIKKRAEVLGLIAAHAYTVAVAGTHGKTTTSSLIAHVLRASQVDCSAFLGGITKNYNTNLLLSNKLRSNEENAVVVVEADEYDRSFLTLHPDIAVITSLDADHLDIYGSKEYMRQSYSLFSGQIKSSGKLIVKKNIRDSLAFTCTAFTYSLETGADYHAKNISIANGQYVYDIITPLGTLEKITLGLPGLHNVENSIAAVAVAQQLGIPGEKMRSALASFEGVKRRFDYQIKNPQLVFIDDYAHHPEELRACISSVKELYPGKKVTGIFQPHLYTRTRDFADEFAKSLELLDEVMLMEIYPARELPVEGVTSSMLLEKVRLKKKNLFSKAELIPEVVKRRPEVLLTLGAGDIDALVEPLKKELLKQLQ